jgi:hypothetical protein
LNNQGGQITVDFLFALVLVLGFTAVLFVVTFTLSMASVTQYITFAAGRNYVAAHLDEATQKKRALDKYHELISDPVFKPLYANGWFQVDADANVGDHTKIIPGYQGPAGTSNQFWGVGTRFVARILDFHIPFFGSTAPDGDGSGSGFKTYIGSYLGREPSADECAKLTAERWNAIRALPVSGGSSYSTGSTTSGYYPMTDNGC